MESEIITLQSQIMLVLLAGATVTQIEASAARVIRARFVTPFVRIVTDAGNNIPSGTTVLFKFLSAALLNTPDESTLTGERFVDTGVTIAIPGPFVGAANPGKTVPLANLGVGGFNAIENPGALLTWQATNTGTAQVNFQFEIHLVCRGA